MQLTGKQKRHLRGLAHPLKPIYQIGHGGVSAGLIQKTDEALEAHELLKIKNLEGSPVDTRDAAAALAEATNAAVVQVIGRTVILYRARKKDPEITLPPATPRQP